MANPHHKGQGEGIERYPEYRAHKYLHGNRHDPWVPNDDWFPWRPSSGVGRIYYTIDSVTGTANKTASVTIAGHTGGKTLGATETVVDRSNCFFADETNAALVGRHGWATLMTTASGVEYVVDGLCCP